MFKKGELKQLLLKYLFFFFLLQPQVLTHSYSPHLGPWKKAEQVRNSAVKLHQPHIRLTPLILFLTQPKIHEQLSETLAHKYCLSLLLLHNVNLTMPQTWRVHFSLSASMLLNPCFYHLSFSLRLMHLLAYSTSLALAYFI